MTKAIPILLLVFSHEIVCGNPQVLTHPAYMSSERLEVKLTSNAAEIDGRFHFRSTAEKNDPAAHEPISLAIPIWVPSNPKNADAATAALLRLCSGSDFFKLGNDKRAAWDSAIGLNITVGKHPIEIESCGIIGLRSRAVSDKWHRKGFCCIIAWASFQADWLDGNPEIRLHYRQGLRLTSEGNEFHYVPVFHDLPKNHTTQNLSQYAMHLLNGSDMKATLGTLEIPAGYSSVLPLAHHEPITITLKPRN